MKDSFEFNSGEHIVDCLATELQKIEWLQQSLQRGIEDINARRIRDGDLYLCELIGVRKN